MVREYTTMSFEEYFWRGVDLDGKVVLDAGTGFGVTTREIARRMSRQKHKGKIISVDINPEAFERARKMLQMQWWIDLLKLKTPKELLGLVEFVKADLSNMPEIKSESIGVIISTRTLADINSSPCRLTKAITEFYRVLKPCGQVVLSDECPALIPTYKEEEVAVKRWQVIKALSHLIGRPHANEINPDDLEFIMRLAGFKECRYAIFNGEKTQLRRMKHFEERAKELVSKLENLKLKDAFIDEVKRIKEMFNKQGGSFPQRYILHAKK
ncbi:MAG: class I SAM-dependent methyltransferase [Candidatus Bathyarchaeia archaeon]